MAVRFRVLEWQYRDGVGCYGNSIRDESEPLKSERFFFNLWITAVINCKAFTLHFYVNGFIRTILMIVDLNTINFLGIVIFTEAHKLSVRK